MGRSWKEISVTGAHNREWTGDPAYRYTARVNGTGTSDIFAETNSCKIATLSRSGRACRLADMEGYHRYQPVAAGERVCSTRACGPPPAMSMANRIRPSPVGAAPQASR